MSNDAASVEEEALHELIARFREKEDEYQEKYRAEESGDSRRAGVHLGSLRAYREAKKDVMEVLNEEQGENEAAGEGL